MLIWGRTNKSSRFKTIANVVLSERWVGTPPLGRTNGAEKTAPLSWTRQNYQKKRYQTELSSLCQMPVSRSLCRTPKQLVDQWIKSVGVRYFSELTNLAQLTEEVGELARIMSRTFGDQSFKEGENGSSIGDELADIMFVVICIANQTGVDLTEALKQNLEKKTVRDKDRHQNNPKLRRP